MPNINQTIFLFSASDPGGADAILPVAESLRSKKIPISLILGRWAKEIFSQAQFEFVDGDNLNDDDLDNMLKKISPKILISGTSAGQTIDKKILEYCKAHSIPSIYILDFWSNYAVRFSGSGKDLKFLPDTVCVMDARAKQEMIDEGFDPRMIKITGNPRFDRLAEGITRDHERLERILFISQPLKALYAVIHETNGFTEKDVLCDLVDCLSGLANPWELAIRLHPKEDKNAFSGIIAPSLGKLYIDAESQVENSISRSRLVVGIHSMVLFQAAVAGKTVFSYQPGLIGKDILPTNAWGLSHLLKTKEELCRALKDFFSGKIRAPASSKNFLIQNATENVIKEINALIGTGYG